MDSVGDGHAGVRRVGMPAAQVEAVRSGDLRNALLRADPPFRPGERLRLEPESGPSLDVEISYITAAETPCALSPEGLRSGFAIVSLALA